jgi:hypothetical protein
MVIPATSKDLVQTFWEPGKAVSTAIRATECMIWWVGVMLAERGLEVFSVRWADGGPMQSLCLWGFLHLHFREDIAQKRRRRGEGRGGMSFHGGFYLIFSSSCLFIVPCSSVSITADLPDNETPFPNW